MFSDIKESAIKIDKSDSPGVIGLPNFHELNAICSVWRMMEWLYNSFAEDCDAIKVIEFPDTWEKVPEEITEWKMRNTERTISYINLASILNGVLARLHKQITNVDEKYFSKPHFISMWSQKQRKNDFKLVEWYRNKLTAHTTYAMPRNGDSWSRQITSLLHISSGRLIPTHPEKFFIGGIQLIAHGDSNSTGFEHDFCLFNQHTKVKDYFSRWNKLIANALDHLANQCPIQHKSQTKIEKGLAWQEL